jgi:phosphoserine phosphatase
MTELGHCVDLTTKEKGVEVQGIPLVVDLDGSLIRTDLLYESFFASIKDGLGHQWLTFNALRRGKASLKAHLASKAAIDYSLLPFNADVLELIQEAKREGRLIYLATASNCIHAKAVADHFGLFDGVFSSDDTVNLASHEKARILVQAFGERGFDYVGNSKADLAIWKHARSAYVVSNSPDLRRKVD